MNESRTPAGRRSAQQIMEHVRCLADARREQSRLANEMKRLGEPLVTDYDLVAPMCAEMLRAVDGWPRMWRRRAVLLVALCLFSPISLAGGRIPSGLRRRLAGAIWGGAGSSVSTACADLAFQYDTYQELRDAVAEAFDAASAWLDCHGYSWPGYFSTTRTGLPQWGQVVVDVSSSKKKSPT